MSQNNPPNDKWQKMAKESEENTSKNENENETTHKKQPEEVNTLDFPSRQQLEDQITSAERQRDEYKQQALRAHAELQNMVARCERDVKNAHKFGVEQLIKALIPGIDALLHGLETTEIEDPKVQSIRNGLQLTLDMLYKALKQFGLEIIDPKIGEPFDPKHHDAVGILPTPNAPPNTVAKVLQKGYQLHERVIRAAMVMVVPG